MKGENAKADAYVEGVLKSLEGRADAKCIEVLTEKVRYWFASSRFWSGEFQKVTEEQYNG